MKWRVLDPLGKSAHVAPPQRALHKRVVERVYEDARRWGRWIARSRRASTHTIAWQPSRHRMRRTHSRRSLHGVFSFTGRIYKNRHTTHSAHKTTKRGVLTEDTFTQRSAGRCSQGGGIRRKGC
eukprot:scaffold1678_cov110-Isochrysis_galbana.AAC.5